MGGHFFRRRRSPVGAAARFGRSLGRTCDSKSSGKTFEDAAESSGCGHGGGAWRARVVNDGAHLEHFSFFSKSTLRFLRVSAPAATKRLKTTVGMMREFDQ